MSQLKFLSVLATVAIAGIASPATAEELPSQISTSVGFTLSGNGAVTSLTLSTALSDTFTYSSGASNNGGVYTEAFAANQVLDISRSGMPDSIDDGRAISPQGENSPSTVTIAAPGPVQINIQSGALQMNEELPARAISTEGNL